MGKIDSFIDKKLIPYTFVISSSPILFHDLLDANRQISDGIAPAGSTLGYKVKNKNMLLAFFAIAHLSFIFPVLALLHGVLADMDCHLSIISAIVFTGLMFVSFFAFKDYLVERASNQRIKEGWALHFRPFGYEEYSKKVADIYNEAIKKKVPRGELEYFIMKNLSK